MEDTVKQSFTLLIHDDRSRNDEEEQRLLHREQAVRHERDEPPTAQLDRDGTLIMDAQLYQSSRRREMGPARQKSSAKRAQALSELIPPLMHGAVDRENLRPVDGLLAKPRMDGKR